MIVLQRPTIPTTCATTSKCGCYIEALDADLPVLAICRGMQLFNVLQGGTLIQHLSSTDVHRQKPQNAEAGRHPAVHGIHVNPDTRLGEY